MNADRDIIFKIQGYATSLLGEDDIPDLQDLLERASDYELIVSGMPVSADAGRDLLSARPPGRSLDDKLVLGIFEDGEILVGVLDILRDYLQTGTWWIGLLLLDPRIRGKGLGKAVYHAFEEWAAGSGAVEIGLGVVEANAAALRFWSRLGFTMVEKKNQRFGLLDQVVLSMRRKIA